MWATWRVLQIEGTACAVKDVRRKMESAGHYSEFRVQQRKRLGCGEGLAINDL